MTDQPSDERDSVDAWPGGDEPQWDVDDLEAAYRQALEACEAVEDSLPQFLFPEESGLPPTSLAERVAAHTTAREAASSVELLSQDSTNSLLGERGAGSAAGAQGSTIKPMARPSAEPSIRSVIEACLFVGSPPLTVGKLQEIIRNEIAGERIEATIAEIKKLYDDEQRPYEVVQQEGAYRLALRPEFERLRSKAYGQGPKEVKLSQEAIEILAVVAYHQPIEEREVNEIYEIPSGGILKQLLRRELLAVQLDAESPKVVRYVTTPRFLKLFQLRRLADLPRAETFAFK